MIEITHYKANDKGAKTATISIKIPKWGNFLIKEISLFAKDGKRWLSMPSRTFELEGQKKYFQFVSFESREIGDKFQGEVFKALDKYLESNSPKVLGNVQEQVPF
jgi:DNA-binding cell septation regulator SpoVG